MRKIIQYGSNSKITSPFFGDTNIIQQFLTKDFSYIEYIGLYININKNLSHDLIIKMIIADQQQNVFFTKDLNMSDVYNTGYFKIPIQISLKENKNYFLCLDSYGSGSINNNVSFSVGYREKMLNLFINNNFSLCQLCFQICFKK